jgi:hypothetical protein
MVIATVDWVVLTFTPLLSPTIIPPAQSTCLVSNHSMTTPTPRPQVFQAGKMWCMHSVEILNVHDDGGLMMMMMMMMMMTATTTTTRMTTTTMTTTTTMIRTIMTMMSMTALVVTISLK